MIKQVTSHRGIRASLSSRQYIPQNSGSGVGMVRYNTVSQSLEVFDGYSWSSIDGAELQIGLDPEIVKVVEWATRKMEKEIEIQQHAERYPIVQSIKDELESVQLRMDVALALVSDPQ